MVALEGRWEEKKKTTAFKMVYIPKRVVEVCLWSFFMIFFFLFWSLVFNCRVTRVARGVLWVGLGLYTTWGKVLPSTGLHYRYMLPFLIDEMGGGYGRASGRAASGRFLLKIENRQKSATVGLGRVIFFCFYEVGW